MAYGFGIIGCGMISNFHARAIGDLRGARVVGCYDAHQPSAERFAQAHGCPWHAQLKDLLADPAVDIVTICSPSGHASGIVKTALKELASTGWIDLTAMPSPAWKRISSASPSRCPEKVNSRSPPRWAPRGGCGFPEGRTPFAHYAV